MRLAISQPWCHGPWVGSMSSKANNVPWRFSLHGPQHLEVGTPSTGVRLAPGRADRGASQRESGPFSRLVQALIRPYGTALVLVALAFAVTFVLRYFFPYPALFLFFAAVMSSAWFGGTGAGLFAVLLSTLVTDYFFVPPFNSFVIDATNISYFGAFVVCALVASWVSASKRKTEEALREARGHLELKVAERTAELEKSNTDLRRTMREHEQAQQALRQTQAELAHLSRALTMGELTSSIAHEINQPLTAVVAHGHACLEWLSADPPEIGKARQTINSILRDGTRAGRVLSRIRALFSKQAHTSDWIDMNEVILELTVFFRDEAMWQQVAILADLSPNLPRLKGDRIQLQQVVLNLMMNAMDAMQELPGGLKQLVIRSKQDTPTEVTISVEDSGVGFSPGIADKIFDPFFTTKPQGIGMGLSISRSIIEAHHGRLWASARPSGGTIFQFTIPLRRQQDG